MDHSIRAIRFCEGGETVTNGKPETACDYCEAGRCRQMEACEVPADILAMCGHEVKQDEERRA